MFKTKKIGSKKHIYDLVRATGVILVSLHSLKSQLSFDTQHLRFIICGTGVNAR